MDCGKSPGYMPQQDQLCSKLGLLVAVVGWEFFGRRRKHEKTGPAGPAHSSSSQQEAKGNRKKRKNRCTYCMYSSFFFMFDCSITDARANVVGYGSFLFYSFLSRLR